MAAAYAFGRGRKVRPGAVRVGKEGRPFAVVGRWKKTFLIFLLTEGLLFGNVPSCRGAVAQLGERLNGIQEVRSSILLSSTKKEIRVCGNADPFFVFGSRRFSPPPPHDAIVSFCDIFTEPLFPRCPFSLSALLGEKGPSMTRSKEGGR